MKPLQRTALASVINLILLGMSSAQAADTQALEKRIRELETRLAKMDQLERRLEKLDQAGLLSSKPLALAAPAAPSPEVEKLNRKVNTLERKLEVQDEVTTGALSKIPNFEAGADGFRVTSTDKKHQLRIGGTLQTDYRTFLGSNAAVWTGSGSSGYYAPAGPDSVFLRQGRIILDGYVYSDLYFKIMADFAQTSNTANLLPDAYLDYNYHPAASLLVGKFKPSISLERLQGDADTVFLERSFASNLAPNRDAGIQIHGAFGTPGYKAERAAGPIDSKNAFTYQVGISDGTGDSGNSYGNGVPPNNSTSTSFASDKEFDGRIFAQPFQHSGYSWLEGLGLGIAGSYSDPNHQAINAQRTLLGQSQLIDYGSTLKPGGASVGTVTSNGASHRIYPQAYWYAGPFGLMGEYVESTQTLNGGSLAANSKYNNISQTNKAAQFQVSYVVTGEDNTFTGIKPMRNFDPLKGSWGALQLAGRWSELTVDSDTFKILDPSKSVSKATAATFGANWFLNKNALIRLDYEQILFNGGAGKDAAHVQNRPSEQIFSSRFQLAF